MKTKNLISAIAFSASTVALAGAYEVPVSGPSNALNVLFIENGSIKAEEDGVVRLRYRLPNEISGEPQVPLVMSLQSTSLGVMHFTQTNPKAEANCLRAHGHVRCITGYDPKIINQGQVEVFLRQKYSDDPRLKDRLGIASLFAHEAIGILTFDEK